MNGCVGAMVRAWLRTSWRAALGVVLLAGAVASVTMAGVFAARRTTSAYSRLLDDLDAPTLMVSPPCAPDGFGGCRAPEGDVAVSAWIDSLAGLAAVDRIAPVNGVLQPQLLTADGTIIGASDANPSSCSEDDGFLALLTLPASPAAAPAIPFRLIEGELPSRSDGVVLTEATMAESGLRLGDHVMMAATCEDGSPQALAAPLPLTITGVSIGPLDVEPPGEGFTLRPVYVHDHVRVAVSEGVDLGAPIGVAVWLREDATPAELGELAASVEVVFDLAEREAIFRRALGTDADLLTLLAAVVAAVGSVVLWPLVLRHVRDTGPDMTVLGALGATSTQWRRASAMYGLVLGLGAAVGAAVATPLLAPRLPRGLGRGVEPTLRPWLDPIVLLPGLLVVIVAISLAAMSGAVAPLRRSHRSRRHIPLAARATEGLRLGPPAETGVRAALGAPAGDDRSRSWATTMAIGFVAVALAACVTFLAGLRHLEQTPDLAGWNWSGIVLFHDPSELTAARDEIAELDGITNATIGTLWPRTLLSLDGEVADVTPWAFASAPGSLGPTVTSGRKPAGAAEVAVTADLLEELDIEIGDTVEVARADYANILADEVSYEGIDIEAPPRDLVVTVFELVGIVLLPNQQSQVSPQIALTLEGLDAIHAPREGEAGRALALLPADFPPEERAGLERLITAPAGQVVYIELAAMPSTPEEAATRIAALESVDEVSEVVLPGTTAVLEEFIGLDLSRADRVPRLLVSIMAILGLGIATHHWHTATLARGGELAVLRSLGFTAGSVRRSSSAQALAGTGSALVIGLPLGVVVGREIWLAYARDIDVVPVSVVPWGGLGVLAGTFLLGGILLVLPGDWLVTRRSPAADLRAE